MNANDVYPYEKRIMWIPNDYFVKDEKFKKIRLQVQPYTLGPHAVTSYSAKRFIVPNSYIFLKRYLGHYCPENSLSKICPSYTGLLHTG